VSNATDHFHLPPDTANSSAPAGVHEYPQSTRPVVLRRPYLRRLIPIDE